MFLAASDVLWPVTSMGILAVEQTADTELLGGCAVPAGPVAGAGRLVAENTVEPFTVIRGEGWVGQFLIYTVRSSPGVITPVGDASVPAHEDEAVGAVEEMWFIADTFPVTVAVGDVPNHSELRVTRVWLLFRSLLGQGGARHSTKDRC